MPLKFYCEDCGNEIVVQFLKQGEVAQCKHCGVENIIPTDASETDELSPTVSPIKVSHGRPEQQRFPTAPVKLMSEGTGKGLMVLLWVGLGWSILLLLMLTIAALDTSVTNLDIFAGLYSSASIFGSLNYPFSFTKDP